MLIVFLSIFVFLSTNCEFVFLAVYPTADTTCSNEWNLGVYWPLGLCVPYFDETPSITEKDGDDYTTTFYTDPGCTTVDGARTAIVSTEGCNSPFNLGAMGIMFGVDAGDANVEFQYAVTIDETYPLIEYYTDDACAVAASPKPMVLFLNPQACQLLPEYPTMSFTINCADGSLQGTPYAGGNCGGTSMPPQAQGDRCDEDSFTTQDSMYIKTTCVFHSCNNAPYFHPLVCSGAGLCVAEGVCVCQDQGNFVENSFCSTCTDHWGPVADCSQCTLSTELNFDLEKCNGECLPGYTGSHPDGCIAIPCDDYWTGSDCSQCTLSAELNYDVEKCNGECKEGFVGLYPGGCFSIDEVWCLGEYQCTENSVCVGETECVCEVGYRAVWLHESGEGKLKVPDCLPVCSEGCGPNSICVAPDECECEDGYQTDERKGRAGCRASSQVKGTAAGITVGAIGYGIIVVIVFVCIVVAVLILRRVKEFYAKKEKKVEIELEEVEDMEEKFVEKEKEPENIEPVTTVLFKKKKKRKGDQEKKTSV